MTPRLSISLLLYSHVDCLYYSGTTHRSPGPSNKRTARTPTTRIERQHKQHNKCSKISTLSHVYTLSHMHLPHMHLP